eukprot:TRINITY_DN387_c0_g1_i2.p1 TRINITY_DN387_c0_g1~~TRINITY_DN387_c0_g1_i2.p1  ORF type:complete len:206 (-),score=13.11 TRINITY_DN387_c0_g1_i2:174-791(-)
MRPLQQQAFARSVRCRAPARPCHVQVRGVGNYLREALEHVFQTDDKVKWKSMSFDGRITHDDHARLRKIHKVIQESVPNDGTIAEPPAVEDMDDPSLKKYLQGAIDKVFNSKGETEPEKWHLSPYDGDIMSQREINRMIYLERIVSQTLEKAEPVANEKKQRVLPELLLASRESGSCWSTPHESSMQTTDGCLSSCRQPMAVQAF